MPELPEVESLRRSLLPHLVGRRVTAATLLRRDILVAPGDPVGGFSRQRTAPARGSPRRRIRPVPLTSEDLLVGSTITALERRGKQLAILAADRALIVQLGMTGSIDIVPPGSPLDHHDPHIHAHWTLDSGTRFQFHDPRRFGSLRVFRSIPDLETHWRTLGPDALSIRPTQLAIALVNSRRPVKAALLDQSLIAGVGNIYADEALFLAGIHPATDTSRLTRTQTNRLTSAIRRVLRDAVRAGGSTLRDYADANGTPGSYAASHRVYGRGGQPCPTCARPLSTGLLAQRTTVWCANCQPKTRPRS